MAITILMNAGNRFLSRMVSRGRALTMYGNAHRRCIRVEIDQLISLCVLANRTSGLLRSQWRHVQCALQLHRLYGDPRHAANTRDCLADPLGSGPGFVLHHGWPDPHSAGGGDRHDPGAADSRPARYLAIWGERL